MSFFKEYCLFKNNIYNSINKLNLKHIKRKSKIDYFDIIYGLLVKTVNDTSYHKLMLFLNEKIKKNISITGFKSKRDIIDLDDIQELSSNLLKMIYTKDENRVFVVDGTYLKTLGELNKNGLKFASKNENYTTCLISCIYDPLKKLVINYHLNLKMNERKAIMEQKDFYKKGDTLIFDRGYYSQELVDFLNKKGVYFIFRTTENYHINDYIRNNSNEKEHVFEKNNIFYKVVNYKIHENGEEYYLITTLINKSLDELKEHYKDRWTVETHFKELKYTTSFDYLNCTLLDILLKEIKIHNYAYLLYYTFIGFLKKNILNNENNSCNKFDLKKYDFNHKVSFEYFVQTILFNIIYNRKKRNKNTITFENYETKIFEIIKMLPKVYVKTKQYFYKRVSKRKYSYWNYHGVKGNKNKIKNKEIYKKSIKQKIKKKLEYFKNIIIKKDLINDNTDINGFIDIGINFFF
jgi:hypothetical protein